ncbi:endonuclease/exonuclease/phosphatase family protein [Siphonobacter sp.]|uniref:endonuclease/exonuclease/phosphatase family protein n=1 Tax=Siphonobacter sp. TaxID=1869184 RepID=UPI003B3A8AFC
MASQHPTEGFFTKLLALGTYALCAFLLIGYLFGYTLWWTHWLTGFWLIGMPEVMVLVALLTLFWFFKKVSRAWFPLFVLILGWPFWQRTIGFSAQPTASSKNHKTLSVTTFNTTFFTVSTYWTTKDTRPARTMLNWLQHSDSDVLCMQEYYNQENASYPSDFKSTALLQKAGFTYKAVLKNLSWYEGEARTGETGYLGPVLFSKYPIIDQDSRVFENAGGHNGYVRADIKKGNDTLRVISLHLYSMGVRVGKVVKAPNSKSAKAETRSILHQLKAGFIAHNEEIDEVLKEVKNSPYPVILCGDYNEVPTGIAYGKTRQYLKNSFEEAGNGFGFTLNRSPWLIRIDNQFHSNHFKVLRHQVHREVKGSDHFPVQVLYEY